MKKKECKDCGRLRFIYSKGRCRYCANKAYSRKSKIAKTKSIRKKGVGEFSNEVSKCDRAFSQLVRLTYADNKGKCRCVTCEYVGFWKKDGIQCGHYYSRRKFSTRWDIDNAYPQCVYCNQNLGGNMENFTDSLLEARGEVFMQTLARKANKPIQLNSEAVRDIRLDLEKQIKIIREEKGL